MFKLLGNLFIEYWGVLRIFNYITFRAAYAAVTALFISFIFGHSVIAWLRRIKLGQAVRDDGPESHLVKEGTPTMGGMLIILSMTIAVLLWQDFSSMYTWLGLFSLFGFGAVGFVDDYLKVVKRSSDGLQARFKLLGQISVSLLIVLFLYFNANAHTTMLYVPFLKNPVLDMGIFYIPFAVFLLVATTNAVNLTDGLDGLAIGLVLMVAIAFAFLAYITGRFDYAEYLFVPHIIESAELTILCFALIGASVGFLWYNSHPAEVFMGDTGSLALGGVIGVLSLMIKKEILLVVVGGVFVLEAMSVIIQVVSYKTRKKRVFKMAPLHHHFELKGWSESKVVVRFWILGGLFVLLSLSTLKIQ